MKENEMKPGFYPGLGIRSYSRSELAVKYMPQLSRKRALMRFNEWLALNKNLQKRLSETGANDSTRWYTPRQVLIIMEELGGF